MTEFDFNTAYIGKRFFPLGCPYCFSEVVFKSTYEAFERDGDKYVYICSNDFCRAYTNAHTQTKGLAVKYEPMGVLADETLREAHELLRTRFNVLWQLKQLQHVFHEFVLSFTSNDGETRYGVVRELNRDDRTYKIRTETGEAFIVPINETSKVSLRTKAYYFLSTLMNCTVIECQIPLFDLDTTYKAICLLEQELKKLEEQPIKTEIE